MSTLSELPIEPGIPVEIGRIDKELGQLWEESGDTKTRASLVNLAIYTEDAGAIASNSALISEIASEHACRALLVYANPKAAESQAKAWITAHCHLAGKGERQVCSEQITFQLNGELVSALPNIVFSHLDSDLSLYLWWQGELHEPLDEKLWVWVERLIYDSAEWTDPAAQFALAHKIGNLTDTRTILCDLNWTRLLGTRFALAQLFDHSCALSRLRSIRKVSITSNKRLIGLLLMGWMAAQIGWKLQSLLGKHSFLDSEGNQIDFELKEEAGADISQVAFDCGNASFEITREADSEYYHARFHGDNLCETPMLLAAGKSKLADVLLIELSRGGKHPLYTKAVAAISPLL